jgi:hypothetical protein
LLIDYRDDLFAAFVIPVKTGIQGFLITESFFLDSRLRGNDTRGNRITALN